LKVTVAEVSRNVMKQLGVNMIANGSADGISWSALGQTYPGLGKVLSDSNLTIGNSDLRASLNAMEQSGVMNTLAEPTLTAVSGEKATFKVGGEFNILSETDNKENEDGSIDRSYTHRRVEYGIGLEFQPVVLSAGR